LLLTEFQDFSVAWLVASHLRLLLKFTSWRFPFIGRFRSLIFSVARSGDGTDFLMMSIRHQNQTLSNNRLETDLRTCSLRSLALSAQP
jgi:hypothetical protein